jgi:ribosomal protein S18 acetylase RimI-like enzyme
VSKSTTRGAARRTLDSLRQRGVAPTLREVGKRLRPHVKLDEAHVWYQLDLDHLEQVREMPPGTRLERPTAGPLVDRVAELDRSPATARELLADQCDIWLVLDDDDQPLFLCYTYRRAVPVLAAPDGTMELPPGVACLEDSQTSPAARGRGIAPAAWDTLGMQLGGEGVKALITKVGVENAPSRRAVEKAGFREIAIMEHERRGPRRRTRVHVSGDGLGAELAARLTHP